MIGTLCDFYITARTGKTNVAVARVIIHKVDTGTLKVKQTK